MLAFERTLIIIASRIVSYRRRVALVANRPSAAAKSKNMAKYFTLWRNHKNWHTCRAPGRIIFQLGSNSETPPSGRHLDFIMAAIFYILLPITFKLR